MQPRVQYFLISFVQYFWNTVSQNGSAIFAKNKQFCLSFFFDITKWNEYETSTRIAWRLLNYFKMMDCKYWTWNTPAVTNIVLFPEWKQTHTLIPYRCHNLK